MALHSQAKSKPVPVSIVVTAKLGLSDAGRGLTKATCLRVKGTLPLTTCPSVAADLRG